MKRALLIMQLDYFSYATYLKDELEKRSYMVTTLNDQYPINTWAKLMGKLGSKKIFTTTTKTIQKKLHSCESFDLVLIIRGRSLSRECINYLRSTLSETGKLVAYNWDSFQLNSAPLNWLDLTDYFGTFDVQDARNYQLPLIELFAASFPDQIPTKDITFSALISNHSNRLAFLDKVLQQINQENIFIYLYEKNWVRFCINFIKSPRLYLKYRKQVHFRPLPYKIYLEKLARSEFTIDFAHPYQTGLTMRCFEAAACKTRIITNNTFIVESPNLGNASILFDISKKESQFELQKKISAARAQLPNYVTRDIQHFMDDLLQ